PACAPPVARAGRRRRPGIDGAIGAVADGGEPVLGDALRHEVGLHRVGALLGELDVEVVLAHVVGVPLDLELRRRVADPDARRLVEDLVRGLADRRLAGVERDALDHAGELLHLLRHLVGAAVVVLEAVLGLRLVGALVLVVGDAVAVVVAVRAAVGVLVAVLVLRIVRALGVVVGDAVAVVVGVRAAVVVLEAVLVLRLVRALVLGVGDAVVVVVVVRAAVGVLEAVLVLRIVRALVDVVGDAVAVLVADGRGRGRPAAGAAAPAAAERLEVDRRPRVLVRRREQDATVEAEAPVVGEADL